jgi:hypothetical protein
MMMVDSIEKRDFADRRSVAYFFSGLQIIEARVGKTGI